MVARPTKKAPNSVWIMAVAFGVRACLHFLVEGIHSCVVSLVAGYIATNHSASAVGSDGTTDANAKKGMAPDELACLIADSVERGQSELIASQLDGRIAMLIRRIWPDAVFKVMQWKGELQNKVKA